MAKTLLVTVLISTIGYRAWSCGHRLGEIQSGQKYLAIEFSDFKSGKKKYAMDDDGMLVLALVAASCNFDVQRPQVKINDEQKQCASDAQSAAKIKFDDQIRDYYPPKVNPNVEFANNLVKEKCGFDYLNIWQTEMDYQDSQILLCAPKAKNIAAKAVKQTKAYGDFMIKNALIHKAQLTEILALEDEYKVTQDFANELSQILSSDRPTVGQLRKWIEKSEKVFENHAYQVIDNPTDEFNPHKHEDLIGILGKFKAKLPFVMSPMCGPGFPRDMLDKLANISWAPRTDYYVPKSHDVPNEKGGQ